MAAEVDAVAVWADLLIEMVVFAIDWIAVAVIDIVAGVVGTILHLDDAALPVVAVITNVGGIVQSFPICGHEVPVNPVRPSAT